MVYAFIALKSSCEGMLGARTLMIIGRVKWFNNAKGYGFIELEQGRDIFVHYSVIETMGYRSLQEGQQVSFELAYGPKGEHAARVMPPVGLGLV
jgi:CspA family cold shock protein